jgi:hypothetical protein
MEVKEIFEVQDPSTGRAIRIELSAEELRDVVQAGLFYLMRQGWVAFHFQKEAEEALAQQALDELPATATKQ